MSLTNMPISSDSSMLESLALVCSFGGILRKLPNSVVRSIEPISEIAGLPLTTTTFEGLAISQNGQPSPVFDFSAYLGGESKIGSYLMYVKSSKGVISLRTSGILSLNASTFPDQETIPYALDEIEEMITSFAPEKPTQEISLQTNSESPAPSRSILLARIDDRVVAFDALNINFMERHAQSIPLNQSPHKRIITLQDGSLINGISLGAWLNPEKAGVENEIWSIGFSKAETKTAITVFQVIGFEAVSLTLFHKLEENDRESFWINHPKYGPIKFLNSNAFESSDSNKINQEIWLQIKSLAQTKSHVKAVETSQKSIGLGLKFSNCNIVIPQELIRSVKGEVVVSDLSNEALESSLKSFDLTKISGLERPQTANRHIMRAISIQHNNEEIVVLAPEIYEPSVENVWHPIPALPAGLSQHIKAIRVQGGTCELLVKNEILSSASKSNIEPYAEKIFCGWTSNT